MRINAIALTDVMTLELKAEDARIGDEIVKPHTEESWAALMVRRNKVKRAIISVTDAVCAAARAEADALDAEEF